MHDHAGREELDFTARESEMWQEILRLHSALRKSNLAVLQYIGELEALEESIDTLASTRDYYGQYDG